MHWILLFILLSGVTLQTTPVRADVEDYPPALGDLRMNEIQLIGTHNSYHEAPSESLDALMVSVLDTNSAVLADICPTDTTGDDCIQRLRYSHPSLDIQLGEMGIRQFELDVFWDPFGFRFARPQGWLLVETPGPGVRFNEELTEAGFQVLHIQDLDFRTSCHLLTTCLTIIRNWSLDNPSHVAILILVETKDEPLPEVDLITFTVPYTFTAAAMKQLDDTIRSVFDESHLLTPDDVRGSHGTLLEAILSDGWPSLDEAKGKIFFALDNGDPHRSLYLQNYPGLVGAVMFTDSPTSADEAAFLKRNDPYAGDLVSLVESGFLVRTRADSETQEAVANDTGRRDQAFSSGAQFVSTDFRDPDLSLSPYQVSFDDDSTIRCNPILTDAETCSFAAPEPASALLQLTGLLMLTLLDTRRRKNSKIL